MTLKLNVGCSKKIGLPDYGSLGASCNLEVELASTLIDDTESLRLSVARVYAACRQAVSDELARQQSPSGGLQRAHEGQSALSGSCASHPTNGGHASTPAGATATNGQGAGRRNAPRRATASQVRALHAIAKRQSLDATNVVQSRYGVDQPEDLSITEASELIDSLKSAGNGSAAGGRR